MSRRVLVVTYTFPPTGGAGVQRVAKFVKYLHEFGWLPTVLTVANPSVPLQDASLNSDIPADTPVIRAKTYEPGYGVKAAMNAGTAASQGKLGLKAWCKKLVRRASALVLQPDAQVLWMPGALRAGKQALLDVRHDAIFATAPPFSTLLLGAKLQRHSGLPLILDYRDEWDLSSSYWENKRLDPLSLRLQRHMQHRAVRAASTVLGTTRSSAEALRRVCEQAGSKTKVNWIYNGYDPADFHEPPRAASGSLSKLRLAYVGTLWSLTSPKALVAGLLELSERRPDLAKKLELVVAGRRTGPEQAELERLGKTPCSLVEHPYLSHAQALDLMRTADVNCAILADLPGAGRVVPAKIFEYFAAGRPILTLAPKGELWDLVREYPASAAFEPAQTSEIASWLIRELEHHVAHGPRETVAYNGEPFDRRSQAQQLAGMLDWVSSPMKKAQCPPAPAEALAIY